MSVEDLKQCPFCAESIQAAAKKCRHCREWLDGTDVAQHRGARSSRPGTNGTWWKVWLVVMVAGAIGVVVLIQWIKRRDAKAEEIMRYTGAIADVFKAECGSLTQTQAYEEAVKFRDNQLDGNTRYCASDVSVPLSQAAAEECLRGPPRGYPPLRLVLPIVRGVARRTCRGKW